MKLVLNTTQTKSLSNFFSNMTVGWFIGAFITSKPELNLLKYVTFGLFSLYVSLVLLKGVED